MHEAARIAVGVDVENRLALQFVHMLLDPFGRAQQHRLLAVPAGIDDGAFGPPAGLEQTAQRAGLIQQRHLSRSRIAGAGHPAVMVIAAHHPLVGILRALNGGDHVIDRLQVPVRLHRQMHRLRAGADAIGDGQRAAPAPGRDRSIHRRQKHLRVGIGNRQRRNFEDRWGGFTRQALGVLGGGDARRERIAGIKHHVHRGAALDALRRTHRPLGVDVARAHNRHRRDRNR